MSVAVTDRLDRKSRSQFLGSIHACKQWYDSIYGSPSVISLDLTRSSDIIKAHSFVVHSYTLIKQTHLTKNTLKINHLHSLDNRMFRSSAAKVIFCYTPIDSMTNNWMTCPGHGHEAHFSLNYVWDQLPMVNYY